MDSRLETFFRGAFRHAEAADTRLGIGREEARGEERKKHKKDKDEDTAPRWEDRTTVSVQALRAFLEGLVAPQAGAAEPQKQASPPQPPARPEGAAARAAGAYQSTARGGAPEAPPAPPQAQPSAAPPLSLAEIRTIHQLIADLAVLAGRNVAWLEIKRSESFLQSLADAVAEAKSR